MKDKHEQRGGERVDHLDRGVKFERQYPYDNRDRFED